MTKSFKSNVRAWSRATATFALSFAAGLAIAVVAAPYNQSDESSYSRAIRGRDVVADSGLSDDGVVRWTGEVLDPAILRIAADAPAQSRTILIGLRGDDVLTCEDLGRQLRRLSARRAPSDQIVVVSDSASLNSVAAFLQDERVGINKHVTYDAAALTVRVREVEAPPIFPFAAVINPNGRIEHAVSYGRRIIGVRIASFAELLGPDLSR